jgi:hypothetical protein
MLIMLRNLEHSLARHVAAAQNVFQEGQDIVWAVRPAEGDDKKRVIHAT